MGNSASKKQSSKKSTKTTKNWFKPKRQTVKNALIFSIIIIAILGIGELGRKAGYWGEPDALRLIKAEKIASKDLLGLELVESEQFGDGILLQRKVNPSIRNAFNPRNGDVDKTISEIVQYAESDGWTQDKFFQNDWVGNKYPRDNIELVMSLDTYQGNIIVRISAYEHRQ